MTELEPEPGSFRDPANAVFYRDGQVLRGLGSDGATNWTALKATNFFREAMASGAVVGTREAPDPELDRWSTLLEHDRIPFISYPYEWTFEMLRDAAILHLELLLSALAEDITMKDGYAFNVQFRGATPTFIDIGSFEPLGSGPWIGYRQFCQSFLYPLLLESHLSVPFQSHLLGSLEGIEPSEMRKIFGGWRRFKKGIFRHVYLHAVAESRVTGGGQKLKSDLGAAGFGKELTIATAKKLLQLIRGLRSKRAESAWVAYRNTCSYSDDDRDEKERFIRASLESRTVELAWDLGANDGAYSRLVAETGAYVVALDADDVTVDSLYRALREEKNDRILPMVMNLVDPSPARGWRNTERKAFVDRGAPDLVLGLALVHHLAIAANVPLPQIIEWFRSFGATLIVEFVEPHDPMAERLLANKPEGLFPDYRIEVFEELLAASFVIDARQQLPSRSRTLYLATPRS